MNSDESGQAELDARLRRLLGGLDAGAGFDERVMRRVATVAAAAPRENLQAQFERRRALLRRQLLREAWMSSITVLGIGACAGALLWRYTTDIQKLAANAGQAFDPNLLIGGTLAAVGAMLWFLVRRAQSGR
jgi:hypothetical protein